MASSAATPRHEAESKPLTAGTPPPSRWSVVWPLTAVLGGLVLIAVVARALARRSGTLGAALGAGGRAPAGVLEVLGRYPVARGATLVLLKLDRRILLLSQSAGGRLGSGSRFATLCEITDAEEVASILVKTRDADGESMAERFRSLLTRFDGDLSRAETGGAARTRSAAVPDARSAAQPEIPVVDVTLGPETGAATLRRRLAAMGKRGAA